ncbi:hypothetical protein ACFL3Z_02190 [Gemmatimonadota bacterium]
MSNAMPGRWSKALLEAAVIVGSILLAFAIDAAWDSRSEARRRDAFSLAIGREMTLALSEADRVAAHFQDGAEAVQVLLSIDPDLPLGPADAPAIDSLLRIVLFSTATFDAPTGAVNGLLTSGDIDLLDEPEFLVELTAFPALVSDLEREQRALSEISGDLVSYLLSNGVDSSHLNEELDVPWQLAPTPAYEIVGQVHFRGLMDETWWRLQNSLSVLADIREGIDRIQRLLD